MVKLGTAVGIIAAQSIGEPGTQLTMRTFHTGGVAGKDITQGLPRVEELFEARNPKQKAVMAEVSGKITIEQTEREIVQAVTGQKIVDTRSGQKIIRIGYEGVDEMKYTGGRGAKALIKDGAKVKVGDVLILKSDGDKVLSEQNGLATVVKNSVTVIFSAIRQREYIIPPGYSLHVKDGDEVTAGHPMTDGNLDLQLLFKHQGQDAVQKYVSKEIQYIYASQGQKLNNKHVEVIVRQMFSRVRVLDPMDTELLPGEIIERANLHDANEVAENNGGEPAKVEPMFLGVTKVSLSTESWLSAASFQETARVLINAAVTGKVDRLEGLKENVIIGRLIPAGTGFWDRGLGPTAKPLEDQIFMESSEFMAEPKEEEEVDVIALEAEAATTQTTDSEESMEEVADATVLEEESSEETESTEE